MEIAWPPHWSRMTACAPKMSAFGSFCEAQFAQQINVNTGRPTGSGIILDPEALQALSDAYDREMVKNEQRQDSPQALSKAYDAERKPAGSGEQGVRERTERPAVENEVSIERTASDNASYRDARRASRYD